MDDPRIARTRQQVLGAVRDMLADEPAHPLTFSRIAHHTGIARKTLYTHWTSVGHVVADFLTSVHDRPPADVPASTEGRLRLFLTGVRDGFTDPVVCAAFGFLIDAASRDRAAVRALEELTRTRAAQLSNLLGREVGTERLAVFVGPVIFSQLVARRPASDALIATIARSGFADDASPLSS